MSKKEDKYLKKLKPLLNIREYPLWFNQLDSWIEDQYAKSLGYSGRGGEPFAWAEKKDELAIMTEISPENMIEFYAHKRERIRRVLRSLFMPDGSSLRNASMGNLAKRLSHFALWLNEQTVGTEWHV